MSRTICYRWPNGHGVTPEGQSQECASSDLRSGVFQEMPGILAEGHSWPGGQAVTEGCGLGGRTQFLHPLIILDPIVSL